MQPLYTGGEKVEGRGGERERERRGRDGRHMAFGWGDWGGGSKAP